GIRVTRWACATLQCGSDRPPRCQARIVRPEQSNASGPAPPHRYGLPSCSCAYSTARAAAFVSTGGTPELAGGFGSGLGAGTLDGEALGAGALEVRAGAGSAVAGGLVAG